MTFSSSYKLTNRSVNEPISVYKEKDPVFTLGLSNSILKGRKKGLLIGGIKLMNYIINSSTKLHAYTNTTAAPCQKQ